MEQNNRSQSLKDYEKNSTPYYVKEILPYVVKRKLFQPDDFGRLGASATHLGMGKIHAKTSAGKYIVEFLNKATIHGLNHIAAPNRHFTERILAILFIAIALACLVVLSLQSWHEYQYNPTSMVLDFDYKNFNITKPAITVCMNEKISTDKFPEVFEKFGIKDTPEARDFFVFISQATYSTMINTPIYTDTPPEKWLEILQDLYVELDVNNCESNPEACMDDHNISTTHIATEKGICTMIYGAYGDYSTVKYWLSDDWTVFPQNTLPAYTYVYRDERISLMNILGPYEESVSKKFTTITYFLIVTAVYHKIFRFAVTLHHPNELPKYDDFWYEITQLGVEDITIDVQRVESSDDLRKLSQRQRPCNYPEDGDLKMWPVYTQTMCLLECRYNYIKSKCGCYPHFARPTPGVPVCNATQLRCIGNLSESITKWKKKGENLCICPDSCNTARYKIIFFTKRVFNRPILFLNDILLNIDLQFPFTKLRHEVFFGFNEFLVLVGGAAGLFLGASIISFIEILYYATLRLIWYKNNN